MNKFLDEDGYPTDEALTMIAEWSVDDSRGWFTFIESLWYLSGWGWRKEEAAHDLFDDKKVIRYNISTAGWSGNESIIAAMHKNRILWSTTWVQSRRGGHYIFEDAVK